MSRLYFSGVFVIVFVAGCGGSSISKPGPTSPHGGILVAFPDGQGFAEVLKEAAPGKVGQSRVIVYFLDRDRNPLTPAPTVATLKGSVTDNKPVPLEPLGATDASKAGALASPPLADRGEIEGDLTVTIGSGPVTVPISVR